MNATTGYHVAIAFCTPIADFSGLSVFALAERRFGA